MYNSGEQMNEWMNEWVNEQMTIAEITRAKFPKKDLSVG